VTAFIAITESADEHAPPLQAIPPASQAPSRGTSPTRPSEPSTSTPTATLDALQKRIAQQAGSGALDRETAGKVDEQLQKITEHLDEGKTQEIPGKVAEIRGKLSDAARKGQWSTDPTTLRLLDRLSTQQ
jgi:serine/threonine-protein kinase